MWPRPSPPAAPTGWPGRRRVDPPAVLWISKRLDRPQEFEPERWADGFEHRLPRGAYFPFGDGMRVCIGRPLAQMELALAVATIAQEFTIALAPGQALVPEPMNTIWPRGGLTVQLKRR